MKPGRAGFSVRAGAAMLVPLIRRSLSFGRAANEPDAYQREPEPRVEAQSQRDTDPSFDTADLAESLRQSELALQASEERFRQVMEFAPNGLALVGLDGAMLSVNPALCTLSGYSREELLSPTFRIVTHKEDLDAESKLIAATLAGHIASYTLEKRYLTKSRRAIRTLVNVSLVRDHTGTPVHFIRHIAEIVERVAAEPAVTAKQLVVPGGTLKTRDAGIGRIDFNLLSQIRSVTTLLDPQFKRKGVALLADVAPDVPGSVNGYPARLRHILTDLAANALGITPAGGSVTIRVTAEPATGATVPLRFTLVDDALDRAWPRDVPSVDARALSVCKKLVELMGGTLGIDASTGSGAYWFTIPYLPSTTVTRVLDAPAREMGDRRARVKPRPERILVAEGNEISRLLAIRQFEALGFDAIVVTNADEAVATVRDRHVDLAFLDWNAAGVHEREAVGAIRALLAGTSRRLPLVGMVTNAPADIRQACLAAGLDDLVAKPLGGPELTALVVRWLP